MARQYRELLTRQFEAHDLDHRDWYRGKTTEEDWAAWKKESARRMDALASLISSWTSDSTGAAFSYNDQEFFFAYDEPIPEGILRVTPEH